MASKWKSNFFHMVHIFMTYPASKYSWLKRSTICIIRRKIRFLCVWYYFLPRMPVKMAKKTIFIRTVSIEHFAWIENKTWRANAVRSIKTFYYDYLSKLSPFFVSIASLSLCVSKITFDARILFNFHNEIIIYVQQVISFYLFVGIDFFFFFFHSLNSDNIFRL